MSCSVIGGGSLTNHLSLGSVGPGTLAIGATCTVGAGKFGVDAVDVEIAGDPGCAADGSKRTCRRL